MKARIQVSAVIEIEADDRVGLQRKGDQIARQIRSIDVSPNVKILNSHVTMSDVREDDGSPTVPSDFACFDTPEGKKANAHLVYLSAQLRNKAMKVDTHAQLASFLQWYKASHLAMDDQFSPSKTGHRDTEPRGCVRGFAIKIAQHWGKSQFEAEDLVEACFGEAEREHSQRKHEQSLDDQNIGL